MAVTLSSLLNEGYQGNTGPGATVTIGAGSTVNPSVNPSVTVGGTSSAVTLDFNLPRAVAFTIPAPTVVNPNVNPSINTTTNGAGDKTLTFSIPRAATVTLHGTPATVVVPSANPTVSNTGTNGDAVLQFGIPRAVNFTIGTVTTGAAGSNASVTINTDGNGDKSLDFTIPRGNTGDVSVGKAIALAIVFG